MKTNKNLEMAEQHADRKIKRKNTDTIYEPLIQEN